MNSVWNRNDAVKIAREHLAACGLKMGNPEFIVKTLEEIGLPLVLYGLEDPEKTLPRSWLVYVTDTDLVAIMSSWVIVVSKTDGTVKYSGSASDEG